MILIISINGKKIESASGLKNIVGSFQPLRVVNIKFLRDKKLDIVNVKLGSLDNKIASGTLNYKGMNVIPLPTELQRLLRTNANIRGGVLVDNVKPNSQAHSIGIIKDDIIVQIEDSEILSIDEFKASTSSQSKKRIYLFRRGNIFAIVL